MNWLVVMLGFAVMAAIFIGISYFYQKRVPADVKPLTVKSVKITRYAGILFTIAFAMVSASAAIDVVVVDGLVDQANAEYDNLMIYYDMVNETDNEYIRYHYYSDVRVYNNKVENLKDRPNGFNGPLIKKEKVETLQYINFTLKGE